jgi:hypothetical protein
MQLEEECVFREPWLSASPLLLPSLLQVEIENYGKKKVRHPQ